MGFETDFMTIVEACKYLYPPTPLPRRRGRKQLPRHILIAIIYVANREGWTLRQTQKWCQENIEMLRSVGWDKPNPPKKSTLHNILKELKASDMHRITAKVKHLKGEISILPF